MARAWKLLALALLAAALLGGPTPPARAEAVDVVLGTGNSVSGTLRVLVTGSQGPLDALRPLVEEIERRSDLRIPLEFLPDLPDGPAPHALVLFAGEPTPQQSVRLAAQIQRGRGVVAVLGGSRAAARIALDPPLAFHAGSAARTVLDPTLADTSRALTVDTDPSGRVRVVRAPQGASPALLLALIRAAVRHGGVRHVESAFEHVGGRLDDGKLIVDLRTALPGDVSAEVLELGGRVLLAEAPLGPIPMGSITSLDDTLITLRFRGEDGLRDSARLWIRDLLPASLPHAHLRGTQKVHAGLPAMFTLLLTGASGAPIPDAAISATFAEFETTATTDAHGAATLRFAAPGALRIGRQTLAVTFDTGLAKETLEAAVDVIPSSPIGLVQCDRPFYESGALVKLRAFVLDELQRTGLADREVRIAVTGPRGRKLTETTHRTNAFGATTTDVRLPQDAPQGRCEARLLLDGRELAATAIEIEERTPDAFEIRVALDESQVAAGSRISGHVDVYDWDGTPLPGAAGEATFRMHAGRGSSSSQRTALAVDDSIPGRLQLVFGTDGAAGGAGELAIHVWHGGVGVVRQVGVEVVPAEADASTGAPGEPHLPAFDVPAVVVAGESFTVTRRADDTIGPVCAELVIAGQVVSNAVGRLEGGQVALQLTSPTVAVGPAQVNWYALAAPAAAASATSTVIITRGDLDVVATASPQSVRPGEASKLDVTVRAPGGAPTPSLLDVRGFDIARTAPAAAVLEDPARQAADGRTHPPPDVLAIHRTQQPWFEVELRSERLARAHLAALTGRPDADAIGTHTPWGARIDVCAFGRTRYLTAARPIGHRLQAGVPTPTTPLLQRQDGRRRTPSSVPARILVDSTTLARARSLRATDARSDWEQPSFLTRHQSPSGALDPAHFHEQCPGALCGATGPEGLEIAATGLCLTGFTWYDAGYDRQDSPRATSARAALAYLHAHQADDGFIGERDGRWSLFSHVIATLGLVESYLHRPRAEHRAAALRALAALRAAQRPDGGFAETGADASLVLAAWAALTLEDADVTGLGKHEDVREELASWIANRTDPATGIARLGADEAERYKFSCVDSPRTAAALSILARISTGEDPDGSSPIALAAARIADDPPREWSKDSAHSLFVATHALYLVGGETWRRWRDRVKSDIVDAQRTEVQCVRGSWNADATGCGRLLSTLFATLALQQYYRYGRVFGSRGGGRYIEAGGGGRRSARSAFPAMLISELGLQTDANGQLRVPLTTPDSVTTWHVEVGAWDLAGRYGRTSVDLVTTLPLHANVLLPARLLTGDEALVPVRVRTTDDTKPTAHIEIERAEGLTILSPRTMEVTFDAHGSATAHVHVRANDDARSGRLQVTVAAGAATDRVDRRCAIATRAVPFHAGVTGVPGEPLAIDPGDARELTASLRVILSPLGEAEKGIAALIRRPTGCCEQAAATLQPAVFAYRALQERGSLSANRRDASRQDLASGVAHMATFQDAGGGFALYPERTPQARLTALAIHVLLDASEAVEIDDSVVLRAARWLQGNMPLSGPEQIDALAAIRRALPHDAGELGPPPAQWNADPYLLALALVHGLVQEADVEAAAERLRRAAVATDEGMLWRAATTSPHFRGHPSAVETTGLVVSALQRGDRHTDHVTRGLAFLRSRVRPDGAWRTTRDTVEALRAILSERASDRVRGKLRISGEGITLQEHVLDGTSPVVEFELGGWSKQSSALTSFHGTGNPITQLVVRGSTEEPVGPAGPLRVTRTWNSDGVTVGESVTLRIDVEHDGDDRVSAPLVDLPLPAGLHLARRTIDQLRGTAGVGYAEVQAGRLRVYLYDMKPGSTVRMQVALRAVTAGTYHTGAAVAYPYYEPDRETVETGARIVISRR